MIVILLLLLAIIVSGVLVLSSDALSDFRHRVLPLPDAILSKALLPNEQVVLQDYPALTAFVIQQQAVLLLLGGVSLLGVAIVMHWPRWAWLLAFLAVVLVALYVLLRRFADLFTRYVLTNFRVMRITGVFTHRNYSIPWVKITDFAWEQSFAGRVFGYATIRIESANEESGLKLLKDLRYPADFHSLFVQMVRLRQGTVDLDGD